MPGTYLIKSLYSAEAGLDSYYKRLRRTLGREGRLVLLASMPKAGSTFLSRTLARAFGYQHSYLAFAYQNVEQELYLPRILDSYGKGRVVQQHFKANAPNLALLSEFGIRPVVLVRNILDTLASLRDHLVNERLDNIPSLHPPDHFREIAAERQLDFVIDYFAPWLIQFYVSWVRAEREGTQLLWLTYETCIDGWPETVRRVAEYYGIAPTPSAIDEALGATRDSGATRMNKGVAGRGMTLLSPAGRKRIDAMAEFYPDIDFSPVLADSARGTDAASSTN